MSKKFTREEVIDRFNRVHGLGKYDYSLVNYIDNTKDITIICKIHGPFQQKADRHFRGGNCIKCSYLNRNKNTKLSTEIFIKRSMEIHGDLYDYSKVEYKNSQTKVIIICKIHGSFKQIAASHLNKSGCPKCGDIKSAKSCRSTINDFIEKSKNFHGELYDYSKVNYKNNLSKVEIICRVHGSFFKSPVNHLRGQGCPSCIDRGFKSDKVAYFYINEIPELEALKYGISNKNPSIRLYEQRSKSIYKILPKMVCKFENGKEAYKLEKYIKETLGGSFLHKGHLQDGWTETLPISRYNSIIELLSTIKE